MPLIVLTISHAINTARNTEKKWFGTTKQSTTPSQVQVLLSSDASLKV